MKSNGKLSISRPTGACDEHILITVKDNDSGVQFLSLEMGLKEFAQAVTGLHYVDCEISTKDLEKVGLKIERSLLRFKMPESSTYTIEGVIKAARQEAQRLTPKGWHSDGDFNSRDSFYFVDGHQWAQTTISRWS